MSRRCSRNKIRPAGSKIGCATEFALTSHQGTHAISRVTEAPRISVLISTFNNARFVAKKLAEIRAQSWFNRAEFIFIETGSPEYERELLAPFCREHSNCRVVAS